MNIMSMRTASKVDADAFYMQPNLCKFVDGQVAHRYPKFSDAKGDHEPDRCYHYSRCVMNANVLDLWEIRPSGLHGVLLQSRGQFLAVVPCRQFYDLGFDDLAFLCKIGLLA